MSPRRSADPAEGLPATNGINMAESASSSPGKLSNLEKDDVEIPIRQEFEGNLCKAETVVVYLDRAEVCRSLRTKVRDGENEILLRNMSPCIERDSVR